MPEVVFSIADLQAFQNGLLKYCAKTVFDLVGQKVTTPQVVIILKDIIAADVEVNSSKAALVAARQAEEALVSKNLKTLKALKASLLIKFSEDPVALGTFGLVPHKTRKPLSGEARVAATEKLKATRAARGTTSKKQKAKISGGVAGVTITPVAVGAAPSTVTNPVATVATTAAPTPSPSVPAASNEVVAAAIPAVAAH